MIFHLVHLQAYGHFNKSVYTVQRCTWNVVGLRRSSSLNAEMATEVERSEEPGRERGRTETNKDTACSVEKEQTSARRWGRPELRDL